MTVPNDTFDFRTNNNNDIINVYFRNANNNGGVAGNDLYFDDIYINGSAEDLTDPLAATEVLLGDVNRDRMVDFRDIVPFIALLSNGGIFQAEADIDGCGKVDFMDIVPFIRVLTQ